MDVEALWRRAVLLTQQGRNELAVAELRRLLGAEPEFAPAHALLAQLLADGGDDAAALREAHAAIAADPELPFAHQALARVLLATGQIEPAAGAVLQAIALDPDDADQHALLAQIRLGQKRHDDALAAAEAGLALEPQDTDCLNLRSLALVRLGRQDEASDTLDASLAHDPDNPYTHQARGFALLHRGDAKGALHHFQEALRRDPSLDAARSGLVEALKARNPLYRVLLRGFLWLERFTDGKQQQILFGAWLVVFVARRMLGNIDGLQGWALGLGIAWLAVVLLTACLPPIFNLLLLLHPLGRHALPAQQRNDALLLGGALLLLGVTFALEIADVGTWSGFGTMFLLFFLLPVAGIGSVGDGWPRRVLQVFSAGLLGAFAWWAIRLELLVDAADRSLSERLAGVADAATQQQVVQEELLRGVIPHRDLIGTLVLVAALSTWFVLLAPKRTRRRR